MEIWNSEREFGLILTFWGHCHSTENDLPSNNNTLLVKKIYHCDHNCLRVSYVLYRRRQIIILSSYINTKYIIFFHFLFCCNFSFLFLTCFLTLVFLFSAFCSFTVFFLSCKTTVNILGQYLLLLFTKFNNLSLLKPCPCKINLQETQVMSSIHVSGSLIHRQFKFSPI